MFKGSRILTTSIAWILTMQMLGCHTSSLVFTEKKSGLVKVTGNGNVLRTGLTYAFLTNQNKDSIVDFSQYAVPPNAAFPSNTFEGALLLHDVNTAGHFRKVKDVYNYTDSTDAERKHLPPFDYDFVQTGSHIIPVERGYILNKHPDWEYILEPGRVWDENDDNGFSRVSIPFSLKQKNQNCVHNGVLTFLFKSNGSISNVAYEVAGETCGYFKFDMWGSVKATYIPKKIDLKKTIVDDYMREAREKITVRPISQLSKYYPGANPDKFSAPGEVSPADMTLYGFVIDGVNYIGGGETRYGTYPFYEELDLPSYSTAKSVSAGLGLMKLEKLYPGSADKKIGNLVSACGSAGMWEDVTLENALDMATGNYKDSTPFKDEGAGHTQQFFLTEGHQSKINYACSVYIRKANPGTKWVYHTSDTYILGTAMNAYLRSVTNNPKADYYTDLVVKGILKPIATNPGLWIAQRTYDSVGQAFSGYGLFYHADDVAKIGRFLNNGVKIRDKEVLDKKMYSAIMNATKNTAMKATNNTWYDNGFWFLNFTDSAGLSPRSPYLIPYMEGYGGIRIFMLPNNTVYYYFSDGYKYTGMQGIEESNRIKSFIKSK